MLFIGRSFAAFYSRCKISASEIRACTESKISTLKSDTTVSNQSQNPTKNITTEGRINPLGLKQGPQIPKSSNINSRSMTRSVIKNQYV